MLTIFFSFLFTIFQKCIGYKNNIMWLITSKRFIDDHRCSNMSAITNTSGTCISITLNET